MLREMMIPSMSMLFIGKGVLLIIFKIATIEPDCWLKRAKVYALHAENLGSLTLCGVLSNSPGGLKHFLGTTKVCCHYHNKSLLIIPHIFIVSITLKTFVIDNYQNSNKNKLNHLTKCISIAEEWLFKLWYTQNMLCLLNDCFGFVILEMGVLGHS